jgi:glucose-6-phosphate 1-dehydrogenase
MNKKDVIIVIFGATGDLTARKLLPALHSLYEQREIAKNTLVLAVGRKPHNTKSYLQEMKTTINSKLDVEFLEQFVEKNRLETT